MGDLCRKANRDSTTRSGFEEGAVEMMVVLVEQCKHDRYGRHMKPMPEWALRDQWCEGAGLDGCGCESEHLGPDGYGCKLNSSGVGAKDNNDG